MNRGDLESKVSAIGKQSEQLSSQLRFALDYIHSDPHSSLTKSRVVLEKIVLDVYTRETGTDPKKPILGDMLANKQFASTIDRRILSRMHAIRDLSNLGPHGEFVTEKDAMRVLDDLCEVMEWYLSRYQTGEVSVPGSALVRPSIPARIARGLTSASQPAGRAAGARVQFWLLLAIALVIAAVGTFLLLRNPASTPKDTLYGPGTGQGAESPGPVLASPADDAQLSALPVTLKWDVAGDGSLVEYDVEVVSVSEGSTAVTARVPLDYVMWPWDGSTPKPGRYTWRVRVAGTDAWSDSYGFAYYGSALDRVLDVGKIRVGMETTYHRPFVWFDVETQQLTGFDVELTAEIARRLGIEWERVPLEWDDLFTGVDTGKVDIVISAVTVTKERAEKFGFSRSYFNTGQRLTVLVNTTLDVTSGDPFSIGTQKGTTSEAAARLIEHGSVDLFETIDLAIAALVTREIDALVCDEAISPALTDDGFTFVGDHLSTEGYGVMLDKADTDLLARIDEILGELILSGFIGRLLDKYGLPQNPEPPALDPDSETAAREDETPPGDSIPPLDKPPRFDRPPSVI